MEAEERNLVEPDPIIDGAVDEQFHSQFPDPTVDASGRPVKEFCKRPRRRTETIFLRVLKEREIEEMELKREAFPKCRQGSAKKRRRRRGPRVRVLVDHEKKS
jgi:hypothetical protein